MRARLALAVVAAAAVAACGGDSEEDKAADQVCDARDDIARQVESLQQLTPQTVTSDAVRGSVEAIRDDLQKINDARDDLGDDLREEVGTATETFAAEVREVASTILRSTSVEEARSQLETAVDQLGEAFSSSLEGVDCET